MTSKFDITKWLNRDESKTATHMLVVCDMLDYTHYPIFANSKEEVKHMHEQYNDREVMSRVVAVYGLKMDIEEQLKEPRVSNF